MAEKKGSRAGQGTFAKLYDVHEQLSRRNTKPLGRPRKRVQRKPTTVHLTQSEIRSLSQIHLSVNEQLPINRSELVGIAIDALKLVLEENGGISAQESVVRNVETFRQWIYDFIKS